MTDNLRELRDEAKRAIRNKFRLLAIGAHATKESIVAWWKSLIHDRHYAFERTFNPRYNPHSYTVLAVLAKLCRADESTFHTNPRAHAMQEGQRHVWLTIQNYSNLSEEQLWDIYGRKDLE